MCRHNQTFREKMFDFFYLLLSVYYPEVVIRLKTHNEALLKGAIYSSHSITKSHSIILYTTNKNVINPF